MNPNLSANVIPFSGPQTIVGQTGSAINQGQPALGQLSAQSPNYDPNLNTPQTEMPNRNPMARFTQGLQPKMNQAPKNPVNNRIDIIIKALTQHLAQLDKAVNPGQNPTEQIQIR